MNNDDCICHYIFPILGTLIGLVIAAIVGTKAFQAIRRKIRKSAECRRERKLARDAERERQRKEAEHQKKIDKANSSMYRG